MKLQELFKGHQRQIKVNVFNDETSRGNFVIVINSRSVFYLWIQVVRKILPGSDEFIWLPDPAEGSGRPSQPARVGPVLLSGLCVFIEQKSRRHMQWRLSPKSGIDTYSVFSMRWHNTQDVYLANTSCLVFNFHCMFFTTYFLLLS